MLKNIIIFCAAIAILSLMALEYINLNKASTDQLKTNTIKNVSLNKQVKEDSKNKVFAKFVYDVVPRFGPNGYAPPHLTIATEKQAEYVNGKDVLIEYLIESSKEARINVEVDKLQPARIFFTVTKKGTIENIKLNRTSNYPAVDNKIIELITKAPGKWEAAENAKGEKVDQEQVVFYGLMGC